MASIRNVAIAGGHGTVGIKILHTLVNSGNYNITLLTRSDGVNDIPASVKTFQVDYDSPESLASALKGQDAVIAAFGHSGILSQIPLFEAAIAAGVRRVIPSDFGREPENAAVRALPILKPKMQVEEWLRSKTIGTSTTWTIVANNQFLDWVLDNKWNVDIQSKKLTMFDGGDSTFTATPLEFVAKGVECILERPEQTANKIIRLNGATLTLKKLLGIMQKVVGTEGWTLEYASTDEREQRGYELLQKDPENMYAWALPLIEASVFNPKFGGDFSKNNANELLGLKELTDAELEDMIRARV